MLIRIPALLDTEQLAAAQQLLLQAPFKDGQNSAGREARKVKHNEEMDAEAPEFRALNNLVMGALVRHPRYQAAVLPKRVAAPLYARYTTGMGYGEHTDDPVMGAGERYRADVAITIFLNPPEEYEGGELEIQTAFGARQLKLPAGDALLYPASSRHRVLTVRSGERRVAITWAQSLIRDPAQRELLFDLHQARETLLAQLPDSPTTRQVDSAYVNLVRMWAEV
jgi:PKHD-type hydroxylase